MKMQIENVCKLLKRQIGFIILMQRSDVHCKRQSRKVVKSKKSKKPSVDAMHMNMRQRSVNALLNAKGVSAWLNKPLSVIVILKSQQLTFVVFRKKKKRFVVILKLKRAKNTVLWCSKKNMII
uniref:Putative serine carboxypeptidase-like 53 n=1 Tax=Lygus hesperus TaxID=30085 RepID=A0A0A9WL01_LYGHE